MSTGPVQTSREDRLNLELDNAGLSGTAAGVGRPGPESQREEGIVENTTVISNIHSMFQIYFCKRL